MNRAKRNTRTLYMHTLDGQPAQYEKGQQIRFAPKSVTRFATSLAQIRSEQKASDAWRAGLGLAGSFRAGHVCIRVSPEEVAAL